MNTDGGQMGTDDLSGISSRIIGCAYTVSNELGCGYLEKVYENALVYEMRKQGLLVAQQVQLQVLYDGVVVGYYMADIVVEGTILVEIKAMEGLNEAHMAQCLNYLKTTGLPLCLLLNFGKPRVQIKRLINSF